MLQIRLQKGLSSAMSFGLQSRHTCTKTFRSSQTNIRNISFINESLIPNASKSTIVQNFNKLQLTNRRRLFADENNKDGDSKRYSMVLLGEAVNASDFKVSIPEKVLVVPSKRPLYPQSWFPLEFTDVDYMKELRSHIDRQPLVGIFTAKEGNEKGLNNTSQVEQIGVLSYALNFQQAYQFFYFHALTRIKIVDTPDPNNPLMAKVEEVKDQPYKEDKEFKAVYSELIDSFNALVKMQDTGQGYPQHYFQPHQSINTMKPSQATDMAAGRCINATKEELLSVLFCTDVKKKMNIVLTLLKQELEIFDIKKNIKKQIEENMTKSQRKYLLHEQLKMIKKELGLEQDEKKTLTDKFNERLKGLTVPEQVMNVIKEEMQKLGTLEPSALEFNMTRTYLDWLTSIPWGVHSKEVFDVNKASVILDEDHYGLKDVKERILEFIAVGKLKSGIQGKIMCLAGPPGVGKTSIGKSIARALGREFYRFSVGGLGDISEIKGHRRTYVGSMPGKIIQCLKQCKTSNPVVLIDEIDKLSRGYHGDPAAALLEVLDPSQNSTFMDHYLDVPVDISKVLFVCTANVKENIPGPLLDRMEVVNLSGYILDEKMSIAKTYLVPTIRGESGLTTKNVHITDRGLHALIRDYCREAGVRNLQKHVERILRKVAFKLVKTNRKFAKFTITDVNLHEYVGKPVFNSDRYYDITNPGVIMGLAWTAMGGATLYVETVTDKMSHKSELRTTGQMGDVMKESTTIAYVYAKNFIETVSQGNRFFESNALHMHIPEGATPKDGPSAGITMVTSLISLALGKSVIPNLAMTGELTVTGKVLPIGGVKEKTIAAKRSGVKTIVFPKDNKKDWEELPANVTSGLTVYFADYYKDVYDVAFGYRKDGIKAKPAKIVKKKPVKKAAEKKTTEKKAAEKKTEKKAAEKKPATKKAAATPKKKPATKKAVEAVKDEKEEEIVEEEEREEEVEEANEKEVVDQEENEIVEEEQEEEEAVQETEEEEEEIEEEEEEEEEKEKVQQRRK